MYGKIFEQIYDSTIISHGGDVIYVFMSMIVLSDKDGVLPISVPALSRRIAKDEEVIKKAVAILESPDLDSNSKEHEGRRIIPLSEATNGVDNRGWFVINKAKYRERASRMEKTEKTAERVRRYRSKCNANETHCNILVTQEHVHTDTDTDTDINTNTGYIGESLNKKEPLSSPPPLSPPTGLPSPTKKNLLPMSHNVDGNGFDQFWLLYPKKVGKGAARKVWQKLHPSKELQERIQKSILQQSKSDQWQKEKGQFVPNPATWLNQDRWDDELGPVKKVGVFFCGRKPDAFEKHD